MHCIVNKINNMPPFCHNITKRVQRAPHEYACTGCNLKITDHETLFETRAQRKVRHADCKVDESYLPLNDYRHARDETSTNVEDGMRSFLST
jgi:hypothetical protein